MAGLEMNSFVMKLKNLWNAGRNATLNLETIAGKVKVSLSVELDNPDGGEQPQHWIQNSGSRNSPAQQRRRSRRAAVRSAAKEETDDVKTEVTEKETDVADVDVTGKETDAAEAQVKGNIEDLDVTETENTETIIEDFIDEFCSEEEYKKEVEDNFEIFQVTTKQFPEESGKNESEVIKETKRNLSQTFNYLRVSKEDRTFKILKSEKFNNCVKMLLKVKNTSKVIESVNGL